jgi:hypothetical protein
MDVCTSEIAIAARYASGSMFSQTLCVATVAHSNQEDIVMQPLLCKVLILSACEIACVHTSYCIAWLAVYRW